MVAYASVMTPPQQTLKASTWAIELISQTLPGAGDDRLNAEDLDRLTGAICDASQRSLEWYRNTETSIENKKSEGFDPVTEADRAVESDIRTAITQLFPDHAIVGEEFGSTGEGPISWVIDPIDGTRAFVSGQPMWGTLVGLMIDDVPVAGWMHIPPLGETFVGATKCLFRDQSGHECQQHTSTTQTIEESILLCTHPTMFAEGDEAESFDRVSTMARMTRYSGDCVNYGLLAMGLADLVIENQLASYDIIPLIPIIESAGGVVTTRTGESPVEGGFVVAAANETLHERALAALNQ